MDEKQRETQAELVTLGLLVVVFALFTLGGLQDSLAMTAGGLVLIGSGIYQSARGWHVAGTTWALGLILLLGGLGVRLFLVATLRLNWVAIGLLLVGALIIYDNFFKRDQRE
jgi:hypothetical protein